MVTYKRGSRKGTETAPSGGDSGESPRDLRLRVSTARTKRRRFSVRGHRPYLSELPSAVHVESQQYPSRSSTRSEAPRILPRVHEETRSSPGRSAVPHERLVRPEERRLRRGVGRWSWLRQAASARHGADARSLSRAVRACSPSQREPRRQPGEEPRALGLSSAAYGPASVGEALSELFLLRLKAAA